jgi:hypothetical protein
VLVVPLALLAVSLLLVATSWLEAHFLSPRALILGAVRARGGRPDHVETLVSRQCALLLDRPDGFADVDDLSRERRSGS